MAVEGEHEPTGEDLAQVSDVVVRIHREGYGRGPTKAKSYSFDHYVLTVLEDFLTTVESTLLTQGRADLVREMRLTFQQTLADRFRTAVGAVLGREVLAYHSQVVFEPPLAFEIFVLSPPEDEG